MFADGVFRLEPRDDELSGKTSVRQGLERREGLRADDEKGLGDVQISGIFNEIGAVDV
jgi:hypothetical protein